MPLSELPSDFWALPLFPLTHLSAPFCLSLPLFSLCQSLHLDLIVYGNSVQQTACLNWELALAFPNGIPFDPAVSDSQCLFCPFLCSLLLPLVLPPLLSHSARQEELYAPSDGSSGFLGPGFPAPG